jgi:CubicO group peptidase (beta-lactamase class C family)
MRLSPVPTSRWNALSPRHIRFVLLAGMISILSSGCASASRTDPSRGNLQESLNALAKKHHVCGVAMAVIRHRQLDSVVSATGCQPAPAVNADSVFQAASLSKPVFAYAVLQLVAQGKLDLEAPVMRYLPQGYRHRHGPLAAEPSELVTDPRLQAITVRMVLNHTSGLPNWASGPLRFESAPGTKWNYSGEGYVLLQRAVEAVTGLPLDQFMAAQVFEPLAMQHSDYALNDRIARHLLAGTRANGAPRSTMALKAPIAAFSLYTSAADYGKFVVSLLNNDEVIRQITASPVAVDPALELTWGLGFGMERVQDDIHLWQWGNNTGYRAFVIASLRTGDGLVMLTNGENGLALAEPMTREILASEHRLFQSPILGTDILNMLCNTLRVCL